MIVLQFLGLWLAAGVGVAFLHFLICPPRRDGIRAKDEQRWLKGEPRDGEAPVGLLFSSREKP